MGEGLECVSRFSGYTLEVKSRGFGPGPTFAAKSAAKMGHPTDSFSLHHGVPKMRVPPVCLRNQGRVMVVFGFTCKSSGYGEGVAVHVGIGEEILQQVAGAAGTSCTVHADCSLMHDSCCRLDVEHRHVAEGIRALRHKDLPSEADVP